MKNTNTCCCLVFWISDSSAEYPVCIHLLCNEWTVILPMASGANKVVMKSRHLIHMTSEVDLEADMEGLPAEPRQPRAELFSSQLCVLDTIQNCKRDTQTQFVHLCAI